MIHSMTAYGRTEDKKNDNSIACEIRTINHRYLEISIRMPEELRSLEQKIRENISQKLKRGKIDCNIRIDKNALYIGFGGWGGAGEGFWRSILVSGALSGLFQFFF